MDTAEYVHTLEVSDSEFKYVIGAISIAITLYKEKALEETKKSNPDHEVVSKRVNRMRDFRNLRRKLEAQVESREIVSG